MKARKSRGTVVIFLETDLEKAKPFDEEALSDMQKQIFSKLSAKERESIRKGYAASVVDLDSGETVCEFNLVDYQPPQSAIDRFARALLPIIQEFYSKEENRDALERWKSEQESKK